MEIPHPCDAEALVEAECCVEGRGHRCGRQGAEIAESLAALAPGVGWLKGGGELVEQVLGFGDAGGGNAVGAAAGEAAGAAGLGECTLGFNEFGQFFPVDEVNGVAVLDVAAAGGGGGLDGGDIGLAGGQTEREIETLAGGDGVGGDLGGFEFGGVTLKVLGEIGVEGVAQRLQVRGEQVEHLVAVA